MCRNCKQTKSANPLWLRMEAKRRSYYNASANRLKTDFLAVQDEIAMRYNGSGSIEDAIDALRQFDHKLVKAYQDIYARVGGDFAEQNYNRLKRAPYYHRKDVRDDGIRSFTFYIQQNRYPLIQTIQDTMKSYVQNVISRGVDEGLGVDAIRRQITQTDLMDWQINRIVRTEVTCASNLGDMYGAKATGYQVEKEWIAAMQERTRNSHAIADGMTVPISEPFTLDNGDQLDFPGDNSYGASAESVVNCRCALGYNIIN